MTSKLRIIVTGYILRWPLGGNAWPYLQYVLGLSRLGHEAYYIEASGESPYCCYDAQTGENSTDPSYGLRFTGEAFDSVGLGDCWAYYDGFTDSWMGPRRSDIVSLCESADVLLKLPAIADFMLPCCERIPNRVLIDTDPLFTQLRFLNDPPAMRDASKYTAYFTFGENIPAGTSAVPDVGFPWQPTRQPVVLDAWPYTPGSPDNRFTSVMKWESYRRAEFAGKHYGMKAESFTPFLDLPLEVDAALELAVGGEGTPIRDLSRKGWRVSNPLDVTRDMWTYQRYLQGSAAEFSIAKHGYVVSNCGWFSERSAVYLASGRPVVAQDTGFRDWLHCERGVLAFSTAEEARAAIAEVTACYDEHSAAARAVAEDYFASDQVLQHLLDRL